VSAKRLQKQSMLFRYSTLGWFPMAGFPTRQIILIFVSFTLSLAADAAAAPQASGRALGTRSIPVSDPTLGMVQKDFPVLPGWQGTAQIDRTSDPLAYANGTLATDMRSPDGRSSIRMLAVPFHTFNVSRQLAQAMPGNPANQRNAALTRFTSTADLLTRYILPALGQKGEPVHRDEAPEQMKERQREELAKHGVPMPIWDVASVIYRSEGRETMIFAATTGGGAGTSRENTTTQLTVVVAPEGKTQELMTAQFALPQTQPGAAWLQADARYLADWREQLAADTAAATREFQRGNAAIVAQGQANLRTMQARGAERDRAFVQHQQQTSDSGANFRGYLSGTGATFKWCGSGRVLYTTNDTRSPSAGYQRCD
jgi:hypothetical protein